MLLTALVDRGWDALNHAATRHVDKACAAVRVRALLQCVKVTLHAGEERALAQPPGSAAATRRRKQPGEAEPDAMSPALLPGPGAMRGCLCKQPASLWGPLLRRDDCKLRLHACLLRAYGRGRFFHTQQPRELCSLSILSPLL